VRERGLKSRLKNLKSRNMRRSREGAWIEILYQAQSSVIRRSLP